MSEQPPNDQRPPGSGAPGWGPPTGWGETGWGGGPGWGGPGGPGGGGGPGADPYDYRTHPARGWGGDYSGGYDPTRLGRKRVKTALWLGLGGMFAGLAAFLLGVAGLLTIFGGGILLIVVGILLAFVSFGLAIASIVLAVMAKGAGTAARLAACIPAALTLMGVAPFVVGGTINVGGGTFTSGSSEPVTAERRRFHEPAQAVEEAASALWFGDRDEVCALLATAARGDGCEDAKVLDRDFPMPGDAELIGESPGRALVGYEPMDGPMQRVRLVREPDGWRLLDLPGLSSECVNTAEDPQGSCPLPRYGS